MKVISVRQPWPWFMFEPPEAVQKDCENRTWPAPRELIGKNILIHAAKTPPTAEEFEAACRFALKCGVLVLPQLGRLDYGKVVGMVRLIGSRRDYGSPWHAPGKWAHIIRNRYPLKPFKLQGQLGYFDL